MIGAIEYLRAVRDVCIQADGRCRQCPLGKQTDIRDTLCPRLTDPKTWINDKTTKMAFKTKNE